MKVFKPNRCKLYCPAVYLNGNIINYVEKTQYLSYKKQLLQIAYVAFNNAHGGILDLPWCCSVSMQLMVFII